MTVLRWAASSSSTSRAHTRISPQASPVVRLATKPAAHISSVDRFPHVVRPNQWAAPSSSVRLASSASGARSTVEEDGASAASSAGSGSSASTTAISTIECSTMYLPRSTVSSVSRRNRIDPSRPQRHMIPMVPTIQLPLE